MKNEVNRNHALPQNHCNQTILSLGQVMGATEIPTLTVNKVLIQRKPRSDRKKCEVFIIFTCCIRLCVV